MFSSKAAPGDMRHRPDPAGADERQKRFHVNPGRRQQSVDQKHVLVEQGRPVELPALVRRQPAHQREAVRMDARRGQPENDVTGRDPVPGQRLAALDRADAEAGEVVIALRIHARHLGRLAADQRAARLAAAHGDRGDHPLGDLRIEPPAGEIIEEEERLGALDDQVVGAHRDEVDADTVVPAALDGELELGADAVIGGDQQGVAVARRLEVEEAAEAAQRRVRAGPCGAPSPRERSP
jgi:hypothetical protein